MIIDFTINIQDAFHSFESLPCEILAPIWNLFILQNDQLWGFPSHWTPIGGPGVFLRPSHSSEHGREVETPLTIIGLLSHMTISHYLLLECTCEFCFKRPIYRRKCAPQEPQASAGEPALVQHEASSWLCRDSLHLAIPAKPKSLNAPYFCPAVEQQLTLERN